MKLREECYHLIVVVVNNNIIDEGNKRSWIVSDLDVGPESTSSWHSANNKEQLLICMLHKQRRFWNDLNCQIKRHLILN